MKRAIAVVSPQKFGASQTFIRAHVEKIDADVHFLYGGYLPTHSLRAGELKYNRSIWSAVIQKAGLFKEHWSTNEKAVISYFIKNKIEVVLAEYGPVGVALNKICTFLKLPLIVHFHGYDVHKHDVLASLKKDYVNLFNACYKIISVSNSMTRKLVELGAPSEKILLNPYGPNDLYLKNKYDAHSNIFLAVGRFTHKKAPYLAIEAFRKVAVKFPEAKLVMAGDRITPDDLSEVCYRLVACWGLEGRIEFKGPVTPEQVAELMGNSFCFIQHSVTALNGDAEGTPVAILEAGLAGLPVVSTKHEGIVDVVIEGTTGLLVDEGDVSGMADRMIRLYENRDLANSLGKNARNHILENYTMKRHISILDEVIKDAVFS